jgi:hypothetical protein
MAKKTLAQSCQVQENQLDRTGNLQALQRVHTDPSDFVITRFNSCVELDLQPEISVQRATSPTSPAYT